ncbi:ty3-gypsy retrotransposon protein [Tanacetum coccineum]
MPPADEYKRWISKLLGYDFEIVYRPGSENRAADALSRCGGDYELSELTVAQIKSDTSLLEGYGIIDRDMRDKGQLVLLRTSSLIPQIFHEMHGGATGGTKGFKRRLLQPLNLPDQIWEELSMDFIDGLPKFEGYIVIMVVIDRLKYWYNTSFHSSIGMTSFKVLYGRDPLTIMGYDKGVATTFEVDRYLLEGIEVLEELKMHLRWAQQLMKVQADGKRRDDQPFEIVERVGAVAYRLKLPPTGATHPVFHVSKLKAIIRDHVAESEFPVGLTKDMAVVFKPEEVTGTREGSGGLEVLVMWEGLTRDEASWERADLLSKQFLAFHLEDKVNFQRGVMIRPGADLETSTVCRHRESSPETRLLSETAATISTVPPSAAIGNHRLL